MKVPLTIGDYLSRGAAVYGDRTAVVDEPGTAGSLGTLSYRELDAPRPRHGAGPGRHGRRPGRAGRDRQPERGPVPDLLLRRQRLRPDPGPGQLPAERRRDQLHRRPFRQRRCCWSTPSRRRACAASAPSTRSCWTGPRTRSCSRAAADGAEPAAWAADEDATASINYTSGTTARPKGVQLTHRNCWLNAATFGWHTAVTDRDVFMHTLPMFHCNGWGMPYAVTGMGVPQVVVRKIDGEEILRRIEAHGVTLLCGAPGRGGGDPRPRRADRRAAGREIPGARHRCGSSWPARRRRRRPSSGSRPSSAGSSSRSTG